MKKFTVLPVVFVIALILAACAKPPVEEMDNAYDAVTRAENDADAVIYAGNTLIRARDALTRMQDEADTKRYDAAKNYAAEAIAAADKAIADGKAGAARAKAEAENLVDSLSAPLAETSNALSAARQENLALDFDVLSGDMDSVRRTYGDARESLAANDYRDATAKCQNVRSALAGINAQITDAAQAASRKK